MINFDINKLEKQVKNKVNSNLREKLSKFSDSRKQGIRGTADITDEDSPFSGFKKADLRKL